MSSEFVQSCHDKSCCHIVVASCIKGIVTVAFLLKEMERNWAKGFIIAD